MKISTSRAAKIVARIIFTLIMAYLAVMLAHGAAVSGKLSTVVVAGLFELGIGYAVIRAWDADRRRALKAKAQEQESKAQEPDAKLVGAASSTAASVAAR